MIQTIAIVCMVIGLWKVFEAVNIPGWWALIPYASTYKLISKFWSKTAAVIAVVLAAIGTAIVLIAVVLFAGAVANSDGFGGVLSFLFGLTSFVLFLPCVVLGCIALYKMGGYFGRGTAFSLGLAFLPPIFLMILAFGGYLNPAATGAAKAAEPSDAAGPGGTAGAPYTEEKHAQEPAQEPSFMEGGPEGSAQSAFTQNEPEPEAESQSTSGTQPEDAAEGETPVSEQAGPGYTEQPGQPETAGEAGAEKSPKIRQRCPSCGAPVLEDAHFCAICGKKLS